MVTEIDISDRDRGMEKKRGSGEKEREVEERTEGEQGERRGEGSRGERYTRETEIKKGE